MTPVNTAVIYHSGYGHTEAIAKSIAEGANGALIAIDQDGNVSQQDWDFLDQADAIIMGSPTYMGGVSWQFKKFADATSKRWFEGKWKNKVGGAFTISAGYSGDKFSTLLYMLTLGMQNGLIWVGQAEANEHKVIDGINRLGSSLGLMAQCPPQDPASAIPLGDLETAHLYGQRIAAVAARLKLA